MLVEANFEITVLFTLEFTFNVFGLKRYYVFMVVGCCIQGIPKNDPFYFGQNII